MNKEQIVTNFRDKLKKNDIKIQRDVAEEIYETVIETIAEGLVAGEKVMISNFGTFEVKEMQFTNAKTGVKEIGTRVQFRVSPNLKKAIKAEL